MTLSPLASPWIADLFRLRRSKLIPTLLMNYDMELSEPEAEWTTNCWWFVMQHGLNVRLTPRSGS